MRSMFKGGRSGAPSSTRSTLSIPVASAVLALAMTASRAEAHDAWVALASAAPYPVLYGHEATEPYPAEKVKSIQAFDAQGIEIPVAISRDANGASARPAAPPAMFSVYFDNGFYARVDGVSRNVGKRDAPGATQSSHPLKWGKTIASWGPASFAPLGHRIEIVPMRFEGSPKPGGSMTVVVLLDGKPLPDAKVDVVGAGQHAMTDAGGTATIKVGSGVTRLSVDHRIATPTDPDADTLSLDAALVFAAR